jgi:choline monooxygenase
MDYSTDPDITIAATLDAAFYRDAAAHAKAKERIFARTWQWIGELCDVAVPGSLAPRDLLPGCVDEPLLLARDAQGELRCLSNVCTHRGNLLVTAPCRTTDIRCRYHSRRFDLAGRMTFMPEFGGARAFPSPADNLAEVALSTRGGHGFVALAPAAPLGDFLDAVFARIGTAPDFTARRDSARDREFVVNAHWALYIENYLEGFHIPFVHPALAEVVDHGAYRDELFPLATLQIAPARAGEPAFDALDAGERIAAYYAWIFPNLMLNVYPWGLSVNLVEPQALDRTRVLFRSYVRRPELLDEGAGAALDEVEREDEAIVEAVQRGVGSRFYRHGRYSPTRERGVHHFHRLLCDFLARPPPSVGGGETTLGDR